MPLTRQAQAFIDALAQTNPPGWHEMSPQEAREIFAGFSDRFGHGPELARVEDQIINDRIRVRLYSDSDSGSPVPAVMYFHGGGWVLGNLQTHDALCRRLAKHSGCLIVAVDYSLAPEHRFPHALDDCFRATSFVANQAERLGAIPGKLAVMGDSAGGNLAAAVCLQSRDEGGPSIDLQVLIYPVIKPDFESHSYQQFAEGHGLTRTSMQWFWQQYLGDQTVSVLAAPSTADSLAGLPACHVITAEYDVLRDEGEAFAAQLKRAGVPTTLRRYDGNLHGFIHFAGVFDDGLTACRDIALALRSHLMR